jgi:N utilization substance protein A
MSNTTPLSARTEFAAAINQICSERGIDPEVVLDTIKAAILAALRKDHPEYFTIPTDPEQEVPEIFTVELDPQSGSAKILNIETNQDVTPPGFGRIAAQTAKQVILQRVREAEKSAIIDEYQERIGSLISGMVLRFDGKNVIVDIGRGQGIMPPEEQTQSEYYKINQRLSVFLKEIRDTLRGKSIIVSRACPELVEQLFAREVPEVASGAVKIMAVAREAGHRTKIAVNSTQEGVDPVGSCVGQKGVRVQEVINELNGEKIDIIQFSDITKNFITASLAPAENLRIDLDDDRKTAVVTVPDEQLSLAIGKGGQNVRLAAKLTGYKLDIVGLSGKPLNSPETPAAAVEAVPQEATPVKKPKAKAKTSIKPAPENPSGLNFSPRVMAALTSANITSLDELKAANLDDIKGIGPKARKEIEAVIGS